MRKHSRCGTDHERSKCTPLPQNAEDFASWLQPLLPRLDRAARYWCRKLGLPVDLEGEVVNETVVGLRLASRASHDSETAWLVSMVRSAANRVASHYGRERCGRSRHAAEQMVATHSYEPVETASSEAIAWLDEEDYWFSLLDFLSASAIWLNVVGGESQTEIADSWGWSRQRFSRFLISALARARQAMPAANAA